jgi:hypothetical protein
VYTAGSGHSAPPFAGMHDQLAIPAGSNTNVHLPYEDLHGSVSGTAIWICTHDPPASPYSNPRSLHGYPISRGAPLSPGNLSGPLSGRGFFPAYNGVLSAQNYSVDGPSRSVEMMPGSALLVWPPLEILVQLPLQCY